MAATVEHSGSLEHLSVSTLPRWAPWAAAVLATGLAIGLGAVSSVSGTAGTAVVAVLAFIAIQSGWSFAVEGRRHAKDRLATTLIYSSFLLAAAPLVAILGTVVVKGLKVFNGSFLQHSMRNINTNKPGGGIYHAMIGTLEQVGIAAVIGIPIGILVAIYLVEYGQRRRLARSISFFIDVMTGVPSIVAGLFVYTAFVLTLGFDRSGFAASLALTILMIPIMVRSTEEMLRLVPNELREGSLALGATRSQTVMRVCIPTALPGIITGAMLAVARAMGETAPLLLTALGNDLFTEYNPAKRMSTLSLQIFDNAVTGFQEGQARAWAGALTLIVIVLIFTFAARFFGRRVRTSNA